jgi:hypothetical protein
MGNPLKDRFFRTKIGAWCSLQGGFYLHIDSSCKRGKQLAENIMHERTGCLICGSQIEYLEIPERLRCAYCNSEFETMSRCSEGHYVCDTCHRLPAGELIEQFCLSTGLLDPVEIAIVLMRNPCVAMHGPEHHLLVPAVLLTSYAHVTGKGAEKKRWIRIACERAAMLKGGSCGFLGDCGAAVGTGIFISVLTSATPLSGIAWRQANLLTAESLKRIALAGGPRCCKRNTFLALLTAVDFVKEHFGVSIPVREPIICEWSAINRECKREECPFFPRE